MVPFKLGRLTKIHTAKKYNLKNKIISGFVIEMETVMANAVGEIVSKGFSERRFVAPTLNEMYAVSERYYRLVIEQGFDTATKEKKKINYVRTGDATRQKKRLAKLPTGLPNNLRNLKQVFNDKTYWRRVMKRSTILTDRLKRQYLQKLKKQFEAILPQINSGAVTPHDVKRVMSDVWGASKSRVETIFRTETTKYFTETQVKFFDGDEDIIGFLFDSIRDTARTEVCRSRHGLIYKPGSKLLNQNKPPCHFNCRSHLIALANTPLNRKLISENTRDPSLVKVVPLPRNWR